MRTLGLVVAEYRTVDNVAGGLDSVAQFILNAFTAEHGWAVQVASPRMSRRAPESRRLLSPRSWLVVKQRQEVIDGVVVTHFGAPLAEVEVARYAPRRSLTTFLDACDAVLVIAGSPAIAQATRRTERPVVLQVATFAAEERAELIRRQRGVRRVATSMMTRLVARLDESALKLVDIVLVENEELYAACLRRGVNARLIAPGVDCELFHAGEKSHRPGQIVAVGRWGDPRKDLETLLRAYALARHRHGVRHRLVLAGVEEPTPEHKSLITSLDLENDVDILHDLSSVDLAGLYRTSDLFALTSTEEGLGLVFLEAMASGVPVVATATAGARYAMGDLETGELVDFGPDLDVRFAATLGSWCSDPERRARAGIEARQNVEHRFDSRDMGAQFRAVIEELLPRIPGAGVLH